MLTPLLATASNPIPAFGIIAALAMLITLGYIGACVIWPFKPCPRCKGTAKIRAPFGIAYRPCSRCHGTGRRVRTGRRAWTRLAHHREDNAHARRLRENDAAHRARQERDAGR